MSFAAVLHHVEEKAAIALLAYVSGLPKAIFSAVAEAKGKDGKLRPLKLKPKVKPKVWYFVFKYSVGIFRPRL